MHSEKEKMLLGQPYSANDKELTSERQYAKTLLQRYNTLQPNDVDEREQILKQLFGKVNESFHIEPPFLCDYGYNIEIGKNFYSNYNLIILDCAKVSIGDNVLIGPTVGIYTAAHPLNPQERNEGKEYALPIRIGNNVWIGGQVVINPGITIGNNSVIGSGSVVTHNIPDNVVAAGNPCRVLRPIEERE